MRGLDLLVIEPVSVLVGVATRLPELFQKNTKAEILTLTTIIFSNGGGYRSFGYNISPLDIDLENEKSAEKIWEAVLRSIYLLSVDLESDFQESGTRWFKKIYPTEDNSPEELTPVPAIPMCAVAMTEDELF